MEKWIKRWLRDTRHMVSPLYLEYIEAMLSHIAEIRQHWRQVGYSELEIKLRLLSYIFAFLRGVVGLTWARLMRATGIVCYGAEQLLLLNRSVEAVGGASGLVLLTLRGLHQATGSSGRYASQVTLRLSPTAVVTEWDNDAERIFGFTEAEIVGQASVGTFIPSIESSGRSLTELLQDVCTSPHNYSFNLNENQAKSGERFWMFWINVPQYDSPNRELTEVRCFGIRTDEPELIMPIVRLWQSKH